MTQFGAYVSGVTPIVVVMPDACIVFTHRDPCEVLPSLCSWSSILHRMTSKEIDRRQIGPHFLRKTSLGLEEWRKRVRA